MLHYSIEGEGNVFVFLHGFLESSTMWNYLNLSQLMAKKIYIDLPGHGKSDVTLPESPSIEFMAEKVNEVLLSLEVKNITIIGHSMGGYVALELAKINSKVKNVVLLNSNFWADSEEKKHDRDRVVEILKTAKDKFIQEAIPNLFSYPEKYQEEIKQIVDEAKSFDVNGIKFATIAMRNRTDNSVWVEKNAKQLFVIQGELDKTAPLKTMQERLPKSANFNLIHNAGHMTHIESKEIILELIKELN